MVNTFLAANTQRGFYSLFNEMTRRTDHNILLIKGGPGTGKSGLMKRISDAAEQKGYRVEQMHCSSDPESLDGVWIKDKKLILLDATAPHCEDPKYPGAVEQIIPLGELWNRDNLIAHKNEIIDISHSISDIFDSIYRMLRAMGEVSRMSDNILTHSFNSVKAHKALNKLFRQQALVPLGKKSQVQNRFVSALSGSGHIFFEDIFFDCQRSMLIDDNYDGAYLLTAMADKMAEQLGYDRIRLLSPLCPEHIDHLILPECSLAIVTKNHRLPWHTPLPSIIKTLPLRTVLDSEMISNNKNKLAFVKKLNKAISDEISECLTSEKTLHDKLEKYYIDSMDFKALNRLTDQLIDKYL